MIFVLLGVNLNTWFGRRRLQCSVHDAGEPRRLRDEREVLILLY